MEYEDVVIILKDAIMTVIMASAPVLLGALLAGLIVAVFQATTQINEQTMALIPKIFTVFVILIFLGSWIVSRVTDFALALFEDMVRLIN